MRLLPVLLRAFVRARVPFSCTCAWAFSMRIPAVPTSKLIVQKKILRIYVKRHVQNWSRQKARYCGSLNLLETVCCTTSFSCHNGERTRLAEQDGSQRC